MLLALAIVVLVAGAETRDNAPNESLKRNQAECVRGILDAAPMVYRGLRPANWMGADGIEIFINSGLCIRVSSVAGHHGAVGPAGRCHPAGVFSPLSRYGVFVHWCAAGRTILETLEAESESEPRSVELRVRKDDVRMRAAHTVIERRTWDSDNTGVIAGLSNWGYLRPPIKPPIGFSSLPRFLHLNTCSNLAKSVVVEYLMTLRLVYINGKVTGAIEMYCDYDVLPSTYGHHWSLVVTVALAHAPFLGQGQLELVAT
ncbi:hypothetical protein BGW80DRAFT_1353374 [Lactifluus volemus]|nr:hypothetical protein BGW80DRAFT_1353374 [Lactifluus volemus]